MYLLNCCHFKTIFKLFFSSVHHTSLIVSPLLNNLNTYFPPERFLLIQLEGELFGCLPSEIGIASAEVTVSGSLLQERATKIQVTDDGSGTQVEVLVDDFGKLLISLVAEAETSTVRINEHGKGVRYTNGV